jgi:hypothetical protein
LTGRDQDDFGVLVSKNGFAKKVRLFGDCLIFLAGQSSLLLVLK